MSELVIDERVFDPCISEIGGIILELESPAQMDFKDIHKRLTRIYRDLQHNAVDLRMAEKRGIESLRSEQ